MSSGYTNAFAKTAPVAPAKALPHGGKGGLLVFPDIALATTQRFPALWRNHQGKAVIAQSLDSSLAAQDNFDVYAVREDRQISAMSIRERRCQCRHVKGITEILMSQYLGMNESCPSETRLGKLPPLCVGQSCRPRIRTLMIRGSVLH